MYESPKMTLRNQTPKSGQIKTCFSPFESPQSQHSLSSCSLLAAINVHKHLNAKFSQSKSINQLQTVTVLSPGSGSG